MGRENCLKPGIIYKLGNYHGKSRRFYASLDKKALFILQN